RPGGRIAWGSRTRPRPRSRGPRRPRSTPSCPPKGSYSTPVTPPPRTQTASPEYLEALYEMDEEGIPTVQARLAEWMGVSPGAVSQAVRRLLDQALVVADGRTL